MIKFREVLKNKNFLLLWVAQVISNFGDRLNQMALVALIYQRNPGSAMALAKLVSFTIIPVFIIGPIAGVWVDRLNRRHVMIICDVLRGLLVFSIPFFVLTNRIGPVYLIVFFVFSLSRFFIPSKMAMIPELVSRDKLLVANTLSDTTHIIGNVVGLVVAGVIVNITFIGAVGGFYIDAVTFFISAGLIAMIAKSGLIKSVRDDIKLSSEAFGNSIRRSFFAEVKEGLAFLAGEKNMRFVVSVFFLLMAGLGAVSCVAIVFIQESFGTATRDLGFLGMFLVGGLFLGGILYGKYGQRFEKKSAILITFILCGVSLIIFALLLKRYPNLMAAGFASGLVGVSVSPMMALTTTLTHETIPEEARGRIFSSLEAVIHLAFLVFMFITAYAAKYMDTFWVLVMVGALFSVSGVLGVALRKKL